MHGEGSEPKVEFVSSVLEFGPILPHSFGDDKEVTIKNPSLFPVEIYSLEFDKLYLEEEKVDITLLCGVVWCDVVWSGVMCVVRCVVLCPFVVWCSVLCCGMLWCDVLCCSL